MTEEPRSDEQLVQDARAAAEGDLRAFETLVQRYRRKVMANCRYISGSPSDAEDLAQEVFLKAYFGLERFEGRAKFKTWVWRIKVNHCLNHNRRVAGKAYVDIEDVETHDEMKVDAKAEKAVHSLDEREKIRQTLDGIGETLRIPLILRDMDQYSYQEIAEALGIGLSAVKMRIKRAREEFRRRYAELEATS